ncbi:MAG: helix-turn-helix domain-containing protein [Candidatus Doudnabacteria bacterium]|nr:helix-turn-helix domain-containing protein [Candidatus Doudnabacteria bacterium]
MKLRIIDYRNKQKFQVDDAYVEELAKLCGRNGSAVYLSLCRHVDSKTQSCFPSITTMARQHNVSKDTIIKGIKILEKWNVIHVERKKERGNNSWKHNTYHLLDKSVWKRKRLAGNTGKGGKPKRLNPVGNTDTKDTHMQGNIFNDAELSSAGWSYQAAEQKLKESKDKAQQIIGYYWSIKKPVITNERQAEMEFKRSVKAAVALEAFEIERIEKTLIHLRDKAQHKWTLETVIKYITEDLSKLKKTQEPNSTSGTKVTIPMETILDEKDLERINKEIEEAGSERDWLINKGAIIREGKVDAYNRILYPMLTDQLKQVRIFKQTRHN